ncbi:hypothetical protein JXA12_04600 [Candidatus Woesearchaeota archaeon]|nr:hypothetical protein [Candidatus Woesearchaeota archaeon]
MADKKEKTIDDFFNKDLANNIDKSFSNYKKWEDSDDLGKKRDHFFKSWYENIYLGAEKAIEDVAGGLDKELDESKHGEKLREKFADMMLGYLKKSMSIYGDKSDDALEFHELLDTIEKQKLKGRELFNAISNFYDQHTGFRTRDGRHPFLDNFASLDQILTSALVSKNKGRELLGILQSQHDLHKQGAEGNYKNTVFREHTKDFHPAKIRLYLRKGLLPQYDAEIENHGLFSTTSPMQGYNVWKGLKHGERVDYKQRGIKYTPIQQRES